MFELLPTPMTKARDEITEFPVHMAAYLWVLAQNEQVRTNGCWGELVCAATTWEVCFAWAGHDFIRETQKDNEGYTNI